MAPVFFSTYFMANTPINTLGINYFHFEMQRIPTVIYNCTEVNLPNLTMAAVEQPTTLGIPVKRPIGKYNFEDLTITFMVDENLVNWLEIYRWMRALGNIDDDCTNNSLNFRDWMTTATLYLTKGTYKDNKKVIFYEIFPIGLSGLKFSSTANSAVPQYASARFSYTYYRFDPDPGNPS
jgi:hypothetical protein